MEKMQTNKGTKRRKKDERRTRGSRGKKKTRRRKRKEKRGNTKINGTGNEESTGSTTDPSERGTRKT